MLNGHHLALLTFSTTPDGESREFLVQVLPIKRLFRFQCWGIEKLAALGDFGSSFAIGQYPETPDADKSSGQDMVHIPRDSDHGFHGKSIMDST